MRDVIMQLPYCGPGGVTMLALDWLLLTYLLNDESTASLPPVMQLMALLCLSELRDVNGIIGLPKLHALLCHPHKSCNLLHHSCSLGAQAACLLLNL